MKKLYQSIDQRDHVAEASQKCQFVAITQQANTNPMKTIDGHPEGDAPVFHVLPTDLANAFALACVLFAIILLVFVPAKR